jgi:hypothetical protein
MTCRIGASRKGMGTPFEMDLMKQVVRDSNCRNLTLIEFSVMGAVSRTRECRAQGVCSVGYEPHIIAGSQQLEMFCDGRRQENTCGPSLPLSISRQNRQPSLYIRFC